MIKICSLFSGSSGNCIFVESGSTRLLVDCGVSGRKIEQALDSIGVDIKTINALLLTHEHSDHVCSVGIVHRKSGADIFSNRETYEASCGGFGKIREGAVNFFQGGFCVGDI